MKFRYSIKIDGIEQDIEQQSLGHVRDFEEALDSGKMKIIFSERELPIDMFSFVEFTIYEMASDTSNVVVAQKTRELFVISDDVSINGKYGYYEHNLTIIEFMAKYDLYQKTAFQFSKDIFDKGNAKYEYVMSESMPQSEGYGNSAYSDGTTDNNDYKFEYQIGINIKTIEIPQIIRGKYLLKKVNKASYAKRYLTPQPPRLNYRFEYGDVYVRAVKDGDVLFFGYLSDSDLELDLPIGEYEIYLGVIADLEPSDDPPSNFQNIDIFKYFVDIRSEVSDTLYDVVMELRDLVSKYGGIESKKYFDQTRLFNIRSEDALFLKTIEAPQIYIPNATLRQTLLFVLSYVNALPRLKRGIGIDELSLEFFGKSLGTYILENISEVHSEQNTNQIGTRSYAELHNILPNDLNKATTYAPYQNGYQTVRATGIQLTDGDFELKLPSGKPMYKPIKFTARLPYKLDGFVSGNQYEEIGSGYFELDLTDILINDSEWRLKEISTNFPSVYYTSATSLKQKAIGLDMYKMENIAWKEGDTSINLSIVSGQLFQKTLLESVLKHQIHKHILTKGFDEQEGILLFEFSTTAINNSALWFKDILFNIEYITNENLSFKQDKEDLEQVSFFSEMRYNQDENTISLARSSAKIYGDLQRTGNKNKSFTKYHRSLNEMYEVGQRDKDGYTIVSVADVYYNDFIVSTYTVTKHHNRISQATFIDQTYRWRDNYASELRQRSETYNDYVFLIPKSDNYDFEKNAKIIKNENTKIVRKYRLGDTGSVPYFDKILFGVLGVRHEVDKTKATVGLVRTDGTIKNWLDTILITNYISTPLSSAGFKGGLVFKIGFEDNQVAGDGLVKNENNWYNQAIRYTDENARIKYFDFYILNKVPQTAWEEGTDLYPRYLGSEGLVSKSINATNDNLVYFTTGDIVRNRNADDSLIVNKDPMSNFSLNYAINIMSYYYGLFVFGRKFYVDNHLIANPNEEEKVYLHIYNNGEKYDIFEDLKVKSGYRVRYDLNIVEAVYLDVDGEDIILNVAGLLSGDTSWAIGDGDGNLILASNERISEIEIVKTHIRPNVKVVGEVEQRADFVLGIELHNEELSLLEATTLVIEETASLLLQDYVLGDWAIADLDIGINLNYLMDQIQSEIITFNENVSSNVVDYFALQFYNQDFEVSITLLSNQELVDGEVLTLNENIDLEVGVITSREDEFSANLNLNIQLNDQISTYQSDTLSLEESISGEIYTYIAGTFLDNNFVLSIYTISEVLPIESDIIDLEEDLVANIAYSSDRNDEFIGIYDLNINLEEEISYIQSDNVELSNNFLMAELDYAGRDMKISQGDFDFELSLEEELTYNQGDVLPLENNIYINASDYGATVFKGKEYDLVVNIMESVIVPIQSEVLSFNESISQSLTFETRAYKENDFDLNITVTEQTSYIQSTAFSLINYIQPTLNYSSEKEVAPTQTEQPTINSAVCYTLVNTTQLHLNITNNDAQEVTIYRGSGSSVLGTIPGGSTRTLSFGYYALPGSWTASITAQASGVSRSNLETKSGNIFFCSFM